jgi:ADP-heptose:LPS heptosyltransferase
LRVPDEARQWAGTAIADQSVHLSVSASSPVKEWPLENWIELARRLAQKNPSPRLVATAGPNQREQDRLRELSKAEAYIQCLGGLSVARLAALLQRCRLHIGADSGALHLAGALGVPTLGIFRRYSGLTDWLPVGGKHRHFIADCRCINDNRNDCLQAGRAACLASITAGQVCELACQ